MFFSGPTGLVLIPKVSALFRSRPDALDILVRHFVLLLGFCLLKIFAKKNPGKFIVESRAASFQGESWRQIILGKFLFETNGISVKEGGSCLHGPSDHYRTHLIGRHLVVSDTVPFGVRSSDLTRRPPYPLAHIEVK